MLLSKWQGMMHVNRSNNEHRAGTEGEQGAEQCDATVSELPLEVSSSQMSYLMMNPRLIAV